MVIMMGHEIDLKNYGIRTDLILDTIEDKKVDVEKKVDNYGKVSVTKIDIDRKNGELLSKKEGKYVTIEFDDVTDTSNKNKVTEVFSEELREIMDSIGIKEEDSSLIIGLGNDKSTPDSLGPKAISNIVVTRYLFVLHEKVENGVRCVSSISPGVMANTGIETFDIISSLIDRIKPSFLIIIDALAASSIDRINKSIQITDTGIHPGSGVGNMRKEISKDTIGIPVIAIGVPTVVESSIIVYDTINYLFKHISYIKDNQGKNKLSLGRSNYLNKIKDRELSKEEKSRLSGLIGELSDSDRQSLIYEVLSSLNYNFIVTPKEIDFLIERLSEVISEGINNTLHQSEV